MLRTGILFSLITAGFIFFTTRVAATTDSGQSLACVDRFLLENELVQKISDGMIFVNTPNGDRPFVVLFGRRTTDFRRKFWGRSSVAEVSLGDTLNVCGIRQGFGGQPIIKADWIQDVSIQKMGGTFHGVVRSSHNNGFLMFSNNRELQLVKVTGETKYWDNYHNQIDFSQIGRGDWVELHGIWNPEDSTISFVDSVIDHSR